MTTELIREYIDVCHSGNQASAARAVGVDKSTINKILGGKRKVTPALADRIEIDSKGRYRRDRLIWPDVRHD